jgi:hypothetical protein
MQSEVAYNRIEKMRGEELTPEEKYEIDQYFRGRALSQITVTEGYQEILSMLQSYVVDAVEKLVAVDPAETTEVLAFHAVAYAASKIHSKFQQDVNAAVDASRTTPSAIKQFAKAAPVPAGSL